LNTQVKLLNDALIETAKLLDAVFCEDDPIIFIAENTAEIDMALREASEVLASVPADSRGGNTWEYDDGSETPTCEGDSCHR
jgi:hypothetical protein